MAGDILFARDEKLAAVFAGVALLAPVALFNSFASVPFSGKFFWLFSSYLMILLFALVMPDKWRFFYPDKLDLVVLSFGIYLLINSLINGVAIFETDKGIYLPVSISFYFFVKGYLRPTGNGNDGLLLILVFVGGAVLTAAVYAILQRVGVASSYNESFVVTSIFFHPAPFGGFLAITLPVMFQVCFYGKKYFGHSRVRRFLYFVYRAAMLIALFSFPLSHSRAAFLGLLCAVAFLAYKHGVLQRYGHFFRNRITSILSLGGLILLLFFVISNRWSSVFGRLLVWFISIRSLRGNIVLGHGINSFYKEYPSLQMHYFAANPDRTDLIKFADEVTNCFNEYIQTTYELGLVGLLFLLLTGFLLFSGRRPVLIDADEMPLSSGLRAMAVTGGKAGLIAFGVFAFFSYPFALSDLTLYFFFLLALASLDLRRRKNLRPVARIATWLILGAIFFTPALGCPYVYRKIRFYYGWKQADLSKNIPDKLGMYSKLHSLTNDNFTFNSSYAAILYNSHLYESCVQVLKSQPRLSYNDLILAGLCYRALNDSVDAVDRFKKAHFLLPNNRYAVYYLNGGKP